MIKKVYTKWFVLRFVFRHRWESRSEAWEALRMRSNYELGIWLKTYRAVGKARGPIAFVFSDKNSVRGYMFGVNLIVCKFWIDISGPVLELKVN
jgi:hypothetical protein